MITSKVERRAGRSNQTEKFDADVVREGLLLQREVSTVSAIEFMKNRGIGAATIQRVLSGLYLRGENKAPVDRQ